jgi:hypothetical protein
MSGTVGAVRLFVTKTLIGLGETVAPTGERETTMRANTIKSSVRFGMMFAAAFGISLAASTARAEGDVSPSGSSSQPNSSIGSAALKYEHGKGLETSIQTGPIGPDIAKMNVGIKLDPVVNGGPLFIVDMPKGANVEASWGNDKKIILKAQTGSSTDGLVTVRHTLTPSVDLTLKAFGLSASFSYNADKLINKIPGSRFNYDSKATQQFAPWGFTKVDTKLNSPDLDNAKLFSMDMQDLPEFVSQNFEGFFGVRAVTKPTFTYKTTKIVISGADGQIADGSSELSIDASDGDYLEVMAAVEGSMTVNGGIGVQPFVHLDQAFGQQLPLDVGYDVYTKDFTTPATPVNFQTVLVHIPMPNVRVPTQGVQLGEVKEGGKASKKVTIQNTGEKEATMTFKSSDSAFKVPSGSVTIPSKGSYDLEVKFTGGGVVASTITVLSNDADSPEQSFKIGANGADVSSPEEDGSSKGNVASEDGCGCKAAGHSSTPGWAGFGLLGLGTVIVALRRSKKSAA